MARIMDLILNILLKMNPLVRLEVLLNKQFNNLLLINGDVLTKLKLNKIVGTILKSDIT